jgi:probable HAF family extracellular repeat protein
LYDGDEMVDLETLGGTNSGARSINNIGQIVGYSDIVGDSTFHAVLFDGTGSVIDLNDLIDSGSGWVLNNAVDINVVGQIVGYGEIGGETHAYLMTPVPEPATICMFGLGGLALRKRKA